MGKIKNYNNKFFGNSLMEVGPSVTSSLETNEYNAINNNVTSSVTSIIRREANFYANAKVPKNFPALVSGTAAFIEGQDTNYNVLSWNSPRYFGSKTISAKYNIYSPSGSTTFEDNSTGSWNGDQRQSQYAGNPLGKVAAIDLYSTHFVLFDKILIDDSFGNNDVFHLLYLIDDKGNKVPLTYQNKSINDLQRMFIPGDNCEVVFLGQNSQNIVDNYPILRVGEKFDTALVLNNDQWRLGSILSPKLSFNSNDGETSTLFKLNLNTWKIDNYIMLCQFSASQNSNGNINLTYNNVNSNIAYGNGFTETVSQNLSPWYTFLYNPKSNNFFENTSLETRNFITPNFQGDQFGPIVGQQSPLNPTSKTTDSLPIKPNYVLTLKSYNTASVSNSNLVYSVPVDFKTSDYMYDNETYNFKILNINFPGPISSSYTVNAPYLQPGLDTSYNAGWAISVGPVLSYALEAGKARILGNGWSQPNGSSGGGDGYSNWGMLISTSSYNGNDLPLPSFTPSFNTLFSSLDMGDIIKCRKITPSGNITDERLTYMVTKNFGEIVVGHIGIHMQLINGYSGPLQAYSVPKTLWEIYEVIRYNKPYLELQPFDNTLTPSELNIIMSNSGSAWNIKRKLPHEQYIESQYLTGSGVGVLIPENYNPELRKQIPDIINKTGIDINSLIQNG